MIIIQQIYNASLKYIIHTFHAPLICCRVLGVQTSEIHNITRWPKVFPVVIYNTSYWSTIPILGIFSTIRAVSVIWSIRTWNIRHSKKMAHLMSYNLIQVHTVNDWTKGLLWYHSPSMKFLLPLESGLEMYTAFFRIFTLMYSNYSRCI